jgi:hypothetical protein
MTRRWLAIVMGIGLATGLTSLIAFASFQQPGEFAPFVISKEAWNAQLSSVGPGTELFRIEYTNRQNWTVTLLSHSANPAMNGTKWSHEGGTLTIVDTWRSWTRQTQTEATVDQWIMPGQFRELGGAPGWTRAVAANGTARLVRDDRSPGRAPVATTVVYDSTTELPLEVTVEVGGILTQRIIYRVER